MTQSFVLNNLLYKESLKILLYGDSIMKGVIYNDTVNKYTVLTNAFWKLLADKINATVTNAAKFGNTLGRALKRLYNDVMKESPDIVLFELGGNDCDFNWDEIAADPYAYHKPKTSLNEFQSKFEEIIKHLRKMSIVPVLLTLPPIHSKRYLSWISKGNPKSEQNILKWLGDVEQIHRWHAQYNNTLFKIAEATDTVIIDIRKEFMKGNYEDYLCIDGIHPNEKGHRIIASQIERFIKERYPSILANKG